MDENLITQEMKTVETSMPETSDNIENNTDFKTTDYQLTDSFSGFSCWAEEMSLVFSSIAP